MTDSPENQLKDLPLKVSISFRDQEQRRFADDQARKHHGHNLSGYIQSLIDEDKGMQNAPFHDLRQFCLQIERSAKQVGVKLERPDRGVDYISQDLRVGIEAKVKYSPRSESVMQQMMAYSAAQEKLKAVLLVIPDDADALTETSFRNLASNFVVVPTSVIRFGALPAELKKLKA